MSIFKTKVENPGNELDQDPYFKIGRTQPQLKKIQKWARHIVNDRLECFTQVYFRGLPGPRYDPEPKYCYVPQCLCSPNIRRKRYCIACKGKNLKGGREEGKN